jgi:hypothetical protein
LIQQFVDSALEALTEDFSRPYSGTGRPSIAPRMLLRAMLFPARRWETSSTTC